MPKLYLNIAVDTPLFRAFDYLPAKNTQHSDYKKGQRVQVPFGRTTKFGIIIGLASSTELKDKQLKPIKCLIDEKPLLTNTDISLYQWASDYYHHPIGEVFAQTLPKKFRSNEDVSLTKEKYYELTAKGKRLTNKVFTNSPRQAALWHLLKAEQHPIETTHFTHFDWDWRTPLKRLVEKNWVTVSERPCGQNHATSTTDTDVVPNTAQQTAIDAISNTSAFKTFLLDGVTGSGKTEVYLQAIQRIINAGKQALILLPEITLTPQIANRFRQRLSAHMVISHSGLNDNQRANAWLALQQGFANILLGTRSAVFTPMKHPGIIILDEEHDTSFKQQEGFRYSARDVAIMRARDYGIPIVLGSATPSLESLYNVQQQRFYYLQLAERTAGATPPEVRIIDCRNLKLNDHLSPALIKAINQTITRDEQVILFVNRRGFAPVLMCHSCGWVDQCQRCDSRMVIHKRAGVLKCHHCGVEHSVPSHCPDCNQAELFPLGIGTERIEGALTSLFPTIPITRIDRDSTRKKGAMQAVIDQVNKGGAQILVGTQMLAKGHHFPNVTLVGMLDIDAGLFSCDFRASERMSQLMTQVAGRAGRENKKGRVFIQTHHPEHPTLTTLITHGYVRFSNDALTERQQAELPPYHYQALLRVNAIKENHVRQFLHDVQAINEQLNTRHIELFGPVPAPMLKRAGRFRYQLLIQSAERKPLHLFINTLLPQLNNLKSSRLVRWSIDVDPVDLY